MNCENPASTDKWLKSADGNSKVRIRLFSNNEELPKQLNSLKTASAFAEGKTLKPIQTKGVLNGNGDGQVHQDSYVSGN